MLNKRHLALDDELQTSLRWLAKADTGMSFITRRVCILIGLMRKDEKFDSNTLKTKAVFVAAQLAYTVFTMLPCKVGGKGDGIIWE